MKVVGLFAGIGGIELGLNKAGHETTLLCEIDPAACAVLEHRFPDVPLHHDVRTLGKLPKGTELLAGGFPCQDLSQAGKTRGIGGRNSGLVNEIFRLLKRNDVPNVLLENVSFMLALGRGHAMRHVTAELERLGYRWAYRVIDSRAFGLPQRRQRLYLVASRVLEPMELLMADNHVDEQSTDWHGRACGFYWTEGVRGLGWAVDAVPTLKGGSTIGIPSSPAIWMPDGGIVTPEIRDAERLQGFDPDWTKMAEKTGRKGFRWKLVGNAVSVPSAEWVGKKLATGNGAVDMRVFDFDAESTWPTAAFGGPNQRKLGVRVSLFPTLRMRPPLTEFLRFEPKPLSLKATVGFISRLKSSSLRYPPEFMQALMRHAEKMRDQMELAVA
ncbi:MAG: DNA (cytosine-5-)-methyltransferase [Opitutae bacterium]|nr:DNA (cytosine-5-)-methyltransferase [Opitutae bacterium]